MIYQMVTRQIVPGKMSEYNDFQVKEFQPMLKRTGMKVAAYWTTTIGIGNETIAVFAHNDWAEWQKLNEAAAKDPDYQRVTAKLMTMTISSQSRLLTPCAWSPMK